MLPMRSFLVLALISCSGGQKSAPVVANTVPVTEPAAVTGVEAAIPGDATWIAYEAASRDHYLFTGDDELCKPAVAKLTGRLRIDTPFLHPEIFIGAIDRDQLTLCVHATLRRMVASYERDDLDNVTVFKSPDRPGEDISFRWNDGYVVITQGEYRPEPATPALVARWKQLRTGKVGVWTATKLVRELTGLHGELLLVVTDWEMPFEWGRTASGTLEIQYASPGVARDAAAVLSAGVFDDPELKAITKQLVTTVNGSTVQARFDKVTFKFDVLISKVQELMVKSSASP